MGKTVVVTMQLITDICNSIADISN